MNDQEKFWAGQFGNDYTHRMMASEWVNSNIDFFSNALVKARGVKTIIELGCNKGFNLAALEYIDQSTIKTGVDINSNALKEMALMFDDYKLERPYMHCSPIATFETLNTYDLVIVKGVLIHINPDQIEAVYKKMYDLSDRYILIAEYYNPTPVEIPYRGENGKLFKRDFAGEMMDKYKLKMIDYGFVYHRDVNPQDDLNWFLLEK